MLQSGTALNWMLCENFIPASAASSLPRNLRVPRAHLLLALGRGFSRCRRRRLRERVLSSMESPRWIVLLEAVAAVEGDMAAVC